MGNRDFTLTSGAKLTVTVSRMDDCDALMSALAKCSKGIALSEKLLTTDVSAMKDYLVEAIASQDVKRALWKCLERASYEDVKVTKDLFDDPTLGDKARQDYFEILWKCIEVNCGPFFARIFSLLKVRLASVTAAPPSA